MSWKPLPEAESLFHSNGKDRSVVNNTLQPGLVVDLFLCVCIRAQLLQSCLTLKHYGLWLLASSVYGTLQARILEQIAMPSFSGSSQPWDQTYTSWVSCIAADSLPLGHWGSPAWSYRNICANTQGYENKVVCFCVVYNNTKLHPHLSINRELISSIISIHTIN